MKNLKIVSLYLLAVLAFGFASCESEDPEKENEGGAGAGMPGGMPGMGGMGM